MALAPGLKIIAPLREWDMLSREDEIEYARERDINIDVTKKVHTVWTKTYGE